VDKRQKLSLREFHDVYDGKWLVNWLIRPYKKSLFIVTHPEEVWGGRPFDIWYSLSGSFWVCTSTTFWFLKLVGRGRKFLPQRHASLEGLPVLQVKKKPIFKTDGNDITL
jgi:hypothetical protein